MEILTLHILLVRLELRLYSLNLIVILDKSRKLSPSSSGTDEHNQKRVGTGILEFTPNKAGWDVTPANFNFDNKLKKSLRKSSKFQ